MHIYDLSFSDGKSCRCIVMEPCADPACDISGVTNIFAPSYLASMQRVIQPPPDRLSWKRKGNSWVIARFVLTRVSEGLFKCEWPGGSAEGDKDAISAAVRANWSSGC